MSRTRLILVCLAAGALMIGVDLTFIQTPAGPRSLRVFDPDRMANLELDMWQAYYRKEKVRLFRGLVTTLHEQNRYTWGKSAWAAFHLARAAARFGDMRADYDTVLPDLTAAYTTTRDWFHADFDPAQVARAELAWWVARRIPGQDSPEQVGGLIADEYALLYGVPRERMLSPAVLRARAGKLRDNGGDQADWTTVSALLTQSYRELRTAIDH